MAEKDPKIEFPGLIIRYTEESDAEEMRKWFDHPAVGAGFPMSEAHEIDDSVQRWIGFSKFKCSLTVDIDGTPVGIATLYLQPYKTLAHQCEFGIILSPDYHRKGIGSVLLNSLMHLAKEKFKIELIHLQVYANNPAVKMYERFGFKEFGRQKHWVKEEGVYSARMFMERYL